MTYEHITVARAIECHNKVAAKAKARFDEFKPTKIYGGYAEHNGAPVNKKLFEFMQEVKKAFRGVEFYVADTKWKWDAVSIQTDDNTDSQSISIPVAGKVYVAYPHHTYCLGAIGFGEFQKADANNVYLVESRVITNDKYKTNRGVDNPHYHYALTGDLSRAVKNAKTYLRQYGAKDFLQMSAKQAHDIARTAVTVAERDEQNYKYSLKMDKMLREWERVLASGYMFSSTELKETVEKWVSAKDTLIAEQKREVPVYYVHVRAPLGDTEQLVDYKYYPNLRAMTFMRETKEVSDLTTVPLTTFTKDFIGKLSVLSLLEDGSYEDGVGMRITENVYWVEYESP